MVISSGIVPQESSYFGALLGTSAPSTSKSPPSIDPHAEYMAGACMVRAPALEVPDFKGFRKEGLKSVPRPGARDFGSLMSFSHWLVD